VDPDTRPLPADAKVAAVTEEETANCNALRASKAELRQKIEAVIGRLEDLRENVPSQV